MGLRSQEIVNAAKYVNAAEFPEQRQARIREVLYNAGLNGRDTTTCVGGSSRVRPQISGHAADILAEIDRYAQQHPKKTRQQVAEEKQRQSWLGREERLEAISAQQEAATHYAYGQEQDRRIKVKSVEYLNQLLDQALENRHERTDAQWDEDFFAAVEVTGKLYDVVMRRKAIFDQAHGKNYKSGDGHHKKTAAEMQRMQTEGALQEANQIVDNAGTVRSNVREWVETRRFLGIFPYKVVHIEYT